MSDKFPQYARSRDRCPCAPRERDLRWPDADPKPQRARPTSVRPRRPPDPEATPGPVSRGSQAAWAASVSWWGAARTAAGSWPHETHGAAGDDGGPGAGSGWTAARTGWSQRHPGPGLVRSTGAE